MRVRWVYHSIGPQKVNTKKITNSNIKIDSVFSNYWEYEVLILQWYWGNGLELMCRKVRRNHWKWRRKKKSVIEWLGRLFRGYGICSFKMDFFTNKRTFNITISHETVGWWNNFRVVSKNSYRLVYVTHFYASATDTTKPRDVDAFIDSCISVYLMTLTQLR